MLRLPDPSADDDVIEWARTAAIAYTIGRCDPVLAFDGDDPTDPATIIPDPIAEAAMLYSARFYRRRDSLDGTIGWGDMGVIRVGVKDNDAEALLSEYLLVVVA